MTGFYSTRCRFQVAMKLRTTGRLAVQWQPELFNKPVQETTYNAKCYWYKLALEFTANAGAAKTKKAVALGVKEITET